MHRLPAVVRAFAGGQWRHDLPIPADCDVGYGGRTVLGEARRAHQPEFLTPFNALAGSYRNTALAQMALLGLPAAAMVQHDSVAAFLFPDPLAVRLGPDEMVHHAVAHAKH